jgi:hypothetical protein
VVVVLSEAPLEVPLFVSDVPLVPVVSFVVPDPLVCVCVKTPVWVFVADKTSVPIGANGFGLPCV